MDLLNESVSIVPALPIYGETPWHRNWKLAFPESFRERTFLNRELGYYHRADIFTPCGTAIEFQNSPITLAELQSREAFYERLIWVVNGEKFKGFKVLKHLPDLSHPRLSDYEFNHTANLTLVKRGQHKKYNLSHPALQGIPMTSDLFSFRWLHPHSVWYEAKAPIIIDLGGYFVYELKQRRQDNGNYPYLQLKPRKDFIAQFLSSNS